MRGSRQFCQVGPIFFFFFSYQRNQQRAVKKPVEKQLDLMDPIASPRVSVPDFLRKPIATCDFPGDPDPLSAPLNPFMPSLFVDFIGTKISCVGP